MAGSLSRHQAVINGTLMISLKFSLMFLPTSSCQLDAWLQVTTAALAGGCADMAVWTDGCMRKKRKADGIIRFWALSSAVPVFFFSCFVCVPGGAVAAWLPGSND